MSDPLVGRTLGHYRLEEPVGRGGAGRIYRARHEVLATDAAVKVLDEELADDQAFRERFFSEARLAAAFSQRHPSIISIYDASEEDGLLYIAMDYVEAGDLGAVIRRSGPFEPPRAVAILAQVAGALDAAHAAGFVHRDVKPANVLVDRGDRVFLTDFGIAKSTRSQLGLTRQGSFVGTIDYCSPEQIQGHPVDGRTDEYSLGCLLFECLTGQPPFLREIEVQTMYAQLTEPPPAVTAKRPGLPVALDGVLARALAKEPGERYGSCAELVGAVEAALAGAPPPPPAAPLASPARETRLAAPRPPADPGQGP